MIKLIWAQTKSGVIGHNNKLPWSIPREMHHFRNTTLNHVVLMGRKTFESLNFKGLPKRMNYVLTKNPSKFKFLENSSLNFVDLQKITNIVRKYQNNENEDLYIIGGNSLFHLFWKEADDIIRTIIKKEYFGDTKIIEKDWTAFKMVNKIDESEFVVEYWTKK